MADRTVSVALRADVAGYIGAMRAAARATREFRDETGQASRQASRSFEETRRAAEQAERQVEEAARSSSRAHQQAERAAESRAQAERDAADATEDGAEATRRGADAQEDAADQAVSSREALVSLGAAAGAVGAALASAGVAALAFAAVSYPPIAKVMEATQDLNAEWDALSGQQQIAAMSVRGLADGFEDLTNSYQTEALQAFNTVIASSNSLLPQLDAVLGQTVDGVVGLTDRLAAFATGPQVSEFLRWAGDMAPQALHEFGTAAITSGDLALRLVQDIAPLGLTLLSMANGVLSLVNALAHINPLLTQFALSMVLLRAPAAALVAGVGGMAGRMRAAGEAAGAASRGTRLLNIAAAAGPTLYVAAGLALGFMALKALTAKDNTESLIDTLRKQYEATGNNIQGHRALAIELEQRMTAALQKAVQAQQTMSAEVRNSDDASRAHAVQVAELRKKYEELKAEYDKQITVVRNVEAGSRILAQAYNITEAEARGLATAAGVDLSTSMTKAGGLTQQAADKIYQYAQSAQLANDPTVRVTIALDALGNSALNMEDRMKAATAALDAYFSPSLAAFNATTQLKGAVDALGDAFLKAKGRADGNTEASRRLRDQFNQTLQATTDLWQANIRKDRTDVKANQTIRDQINVLYAFAGSNKVLRTQVDALALSINKTTGATNISKRAFFAAAEAMGFGKTKTRELWKEFQKLYDTASKPVRITVDAKGRWQTPTSMGGRPMATGGPVPMVDGSEPGKDSVPALLMPDEHVWTVREVQAAGGHGAMYRLRAAALRGDLKGYAKGGAVSMTNPRSDMGDVVEPIYAGIRGLVGAIGKEMAAQWKKYVGSAGGVVSAALRWLGTPYSWGGGGIGGPSRGIGRGAGTVGFDCSGLTQYAWYAGRHIDIGGTTYSQYPNSRLIGSPRPGALGFPHMGHVVLASSKPGWIIEAPYTGSYVRHVPSSRGYEWRWPAKAFARGGPVSASERMLGREYVDASSEGQFIEAKVLGIAGDPGGILPGTRGPRVRAGTYDQGGLLRPGYTLVWNGTGADELVVPMAAGGGVKPGPGGGSGGGPKIRQLPYTRAPLTDAQKAIRDLLEEIRKGALDSADSVRQFMDKIREQIRRQFSGAEERRLLQWTQRIQKSMEAAATRAQAIADRIKEATDYAASTTQNARTFAGLSNLSDRGSAAGIVTGLQGRAAQLKEFTGLIVQLRARGINMSLLRQVIDMGPADGAEVARTLLAVDRATWVGINQAQGEIDRAADVLGKTAADALYDQGKGAARGFLTGLKDQEAELGRLMDRLGDRLTARLRNAYDFPGTMRVTPGGRGPGRVVPVGGRVVQQNFYVTVQDRADVDMLMNEAGFKAQAASF